MTCILYTVEIVYKVNFATLPFSVVFRFKNVLYLPPCPNPRNKKKSEHLDICSV